MFVCVNSKTNTYKMKKKTYVRVFQLHPLVRTVNQLRHQLPVALNVSTRIYINKVGHYVPACVCVCVTV